VEKKMRSLIAIAALMLAMSAQSATWMQGYGGMGEYKTRPLPSPVTEFDLRRGADYWDGEQQIMLRLNLYGPCEDSRFFIFAKYGNVWSIQIDGGELLSPHDGSDVSPFRNLPRNVSYIDIEQSLLGGTSLAVRRGMDADSDPILNVPLTPLHELISVRNEVCEATTAGSQNTP
jgi:hypothetical protein